MNEWMGKNLMSSLSPFVTPALLCTLLLSQPHDVHEKKIKMKMKVKKRDRESQKKEKKKRSKKVKETIEESIK